MWSDKEDKLLISMWSNGAIALDIAKALKKTRGSVVGRISRLRASGVNLAARPRVKTSKRIRKKPMPKIISQQEFERDPYRDPCDIMGLRYFSCRYIVKEKPTLYCNQLVHKHSYCKEHFVLCYQQGTSNAAA